VDHEASSGRTAKEKGNRGYRPRHGECMSSWAAASGGPVTQMAGWNDHQLNEGATAGSRPVFASCRRNSTPAHIGRKRSEACLPGSRTPRKIPRLGPFVIGRAGAWPPPFHGHGLHDKLNVAMTEKREHTPALQAVSLNTGTSTSSGTFSLSG